MAVFRQHKAGQPPADQWPLHSSRLSARSLPDTAPHVTAQLRSLDVLVSVPETADRTHGASRLCVHGGGGSVTGCRQELMGYGGVHGVPELGAAGPHWRASPVPRSCGKRSVICPCSLPPTPAILPVGRPFISELVIPAVADLGALLNEQYASLYDDVFLMMR